MPRQPLRRNLDYYEGRAVYVRLFGTARQEEFTGVIEAFRSQFALEMVLIVENAFLVSTFRSAGSPPRFDSFVLLSRPCEIKFGYIEQDKIEAQAILLDPGRALFDAGECMLLFFLNGVWELADPMDA